MRQHGYALPLRIRKAAESFVVEEASGVALARIEQHSEHLWNQLSDQEFICVRSSVIFVAAKEIAMHAILFIFLVFFAAIFGDRALACNSPKEVCDAILWCLKEPSARNANNREKLNDAVKKGVWSEIHAWTDICQNHLGTMPKEWQRASGGCKENDFVEAGRKADEYRNAGKDHCEGQITKQYCYTQGRYYEIGHLGPPGTGICEVIGSACACGNSPGSLK